MDIEGNEYFLKDPNNVFKTGDNGEFLIDSGNGYVRGECNIIDGELVASPIEDLEDAA